MSLTLALILQFTPLRADVGGPRPPTDGTKPLFGVGQYGYFENSEKLKQIEKSNPELYKKLRADADAVKKASEKAPKDGNTGLPVSTGLGKHLGETGEGKPSVLPGRVPAANRKSEETLSGDDIPSEVTFGKKTLRK